MNIHSNIIGAYQEKPLNANQTFLISNYADHGKSLHTERRSKTNVKQRFNPLLNPSLAPSKKI